MCVCVAGSLSATLGVYLHATVGVCLNTSFAYNTWYICVCVTGGVHVAVIMEVGL